MITRKRSCSLEKATTTGLFEIMTLKLTYNSAWQNWRRESFHEYYDKYCAHPSLRCIHGRRAEKHMDVLLYKQTNKMYFLYVFILQPLYNSTCFERPFRSSSAVHDLLYLQVCTNRANVS
jgi:hypothetical protein